MEAPTRAGWYRPSANSAYHWTDNGTRPLCGNVAASGYPKPDTAIRATLPTGVYPCGHCSRYVERRAAKAPPPAPVVEVPAIDPAQLPLFKD